MEIPMTQEDYEATQPATQRDDDMIVDPYANPLPPGCWGVMVPTSPSLCINRIPFAMPPGTSITIGRARRNNVCLDAKTISNHHCEIWRDHNLRDIWLKDTSTNGTYVRGKKVGKGILTVLKHGDIIKLGSHSDTGIGFYWQDPSKQLPQDPLSFCGGIWRKYDFVEALGMGAFAKVSRVIERGTSTARAVKHIQKSRLRSEANKGMFEKEMMIQNEINHPNVVRLIECFEDENDLCLVLEYVDGGDLLNYVSKRGGLSEEDARKIAKMLFPAIAAFHAKKIVHRDLKPDNILITHGASPVVKIADFGLAKMVQEGSELRTTCGTPTWLAPEVIVKEFGPYTDKCDAWAMGLVIFSCMINALPFEPENSELPLATRLEARVPNWNYLPQGTSAECQDFLRQLCRQKVQERMSVTEACQHPWIRDDANLRVLRTVRAEPSFSEGWIMESLAPNPSYTAAKSFQLSPQTNGSPSALSPPITEDQLPVPNQPEDSNVEMKSASSSLKFALNHFPVAPPNPGPESAGLRTLMDRMELQVPPSSSGKRKAEDMEVSEDVITPQPKRRTKNNTKKTTDPTPPLRRTTRKTAGSKTDAAAKVPTRRKT
ncbi:Pkinase-domain-containing protein [Atractiella rhizophila]|nr:Pkinase-domain-containing protein [Atractiella rhizophila]